MINREHYLPITKQAQVLRISRGSVYYLTRPMAAGIAYIEKKRPRTTIFAFIVLCALLLWNSITRPYFEHTAYQPVGLIGDVKPYVRLSH